MSLFRRRRRPRVSVVIVFHDMRREARRTLPAFTTAQQRGIAEDDYEVIVVDSHSREPLDRSWVEGLQGNFRYAYVESPDPTPNRAMNRGLAMARAPLVMCAIDGARIPTPRMIDLSLRAQAHFGPAYVMTLGMHLGHKRQNLAVSEGYCQAVEDELLASIDWQADGYELFSIAAPAGSSQAGFFGEISESNCFTVPRTAIEAIGGFDERFRTSGGGLINLHVHNQLMDRPELQPVMLLGEATFHQFHGGVSTNVPAEQSPFARYAEEYAALFGHPYRRSWRAPLYFGTCPEVARRFLLVGTAPTPPSPVPVAHAR